MASLDAEPICLPDEAWRTTAALRMLRSRDFRAVFKFVLHQNVTPAILALKTGLSEDMVRKVVSGDEIVTSVEQIERIAQALDMPLPARTALGLPPRSRDPLHMPSEFWAQADIACALAGWDVPAVLAAIISRRHWSQYQLADVLGYSQSWVSNVMLATQSLTLDQARTILRQFGAPLHQIAISPVHAEDNDQLAREAVPEVVTRWTGGLACALRSAWRLSAAEFADKLGVSVRMISTCEADPTFVLPFSMQQVLGMALDEAPENVQARFDLLRDSDVVRTANVRSDRGSETKSSGDADEIESAAHDAELEQFGLLAVPGVEAIATLWDEVAEIARSGNRAPRKIFTAARLIRNQALHLADRTRRPSALADLYAIARTGDRPHGQYRLRSEPVERGGDSRPVGRTLRNPHRQSILAGLDSWPFGADRELAQRTRHCAQPFPSRTPSRATGSTESSAPLHRGALICRTRRLGVRSGSA